MSRVLLTALAVLGVAAGLAVTASSTSHVAYQQGMRGLALAALVVVIEVMNTVGTWTWLTDPRPHVKAEAAVFVGLASLVTGWCGAITYGPIGLVGPAFVLGSVHLVSRQATRPDTPAAEGPTADIAPHTATEGVSELPPGHSDPPVTEDPDLSRRDTPVTSHVTDPATPPVTPVTDDDVTRVADLRAHAAELGRMPGRDAVKARYGVGSATANRLRDQASRPSLHLASGGAS